MIHSLSGGKIHDLEYANFAKVEIIEGGDVGKIFWYKFNILDLKVGDVVLVPLLNNNVKAKVLKIELNVSSQVSPMPIKRAKSILQKID